MEENPKRPATTPHRPTEGGNNTVATTHKKQVRAAEVTRGRGRPKGSRNKPKALIGKEVASELLGVVKQTLPPELYDEMKEAVKSGKNISTLNEAKILMKLMGPPVWQRLIEESKARIQPSFEVYDPDLAEEIGPQESQTKPFDKDLNERLKVLLQVMQFVDKLEKDAEGTHTSAQPVIEIFARRGIRAGRIDFISQDLSGSVGGSADGVRRVGPESGTVSVEFPEGQIDLQDSEQVATVRLLNDDSAGDLSQSLHDEEL